MQNKPLTIVVFGITGDLFSRKLCKALFDLFQKNMLPKRFAIIGFARREYSQSDFRAYITEIIKKLSPESQSDVVESFSSTITYVQGNLDVLADYETLGNTMQKQDEVWGYCSDKLFYLAVSPALYETTFKQLSLSGLAIPCVPGSEGEESAWSRVLVEKPFGTNAQEAEKLEGLLSALFTEEQIFRIDHYLAKETIQNIIVFRFSNGMFAPLWNKEHIEKVEIEFAETHTVYSRGDFYDKFGALLDVGQNHMLQMLALVAMEYPKELSAQAIRTKRAEVLSQIVLPIDHKSGTESLSYIARAQYEGYLNELHIPAESKTETFFRVKLAIENENWKGVPFYISSGKALSESRVDIKVFFKQSACICSEHHDEPHQNILTFHIQPREGISIQFFAKHPGFEMSLDRKELSFEYAKKPPTPTPPTSATEVTVAEKTPDPYERVLFDAIRGDQTLFPSTEEVAQQWRIVSSIIDAWKEIPLIKYPKGSVIDDII